VERRWKLKNKDKTILFMDILIRLLIQFTECTEEEAIIFVLKLLDKLDIAGIKIK